MEILNYLLPVNLYLLLFYAFYRLVLRNETFFKLNRVYLAGSGLLSFLIPLISWEWVQNLFITGQVRQVTQTVNAVVSYTITPTDENTGLSADEILLIAYFAGLSVFLFLFVLKLIRINRLLKQDTAQQAWSFFNKVAVNSTLPGSETILQHELVHARQFHSADVLFFEVVAVINWFNPVVYLYKKAAKHIHEFIADEASSQHLLSKAEYALLLLSSTLGVQPHQLTNSFFNHSLLKRRIIMLHKTKSNRVAVLKYGLAVPLFAGMLVFSAACTKENPTTELPPVELKEYETTILDPQDPIMDFASVEVLPEFPGGGIPTLIKYINEKYNAPTQAVKNKVSGRMIMSFVVEKDGSIADIKIIRDLGSGTSEEMIRLLKEGPKWKPGIQNGHPVSVAYTLPVLIDHSDDAKDSTK